MTKPRNYPGKDKKMKIMQHLFTLSFFPTSQLTIAHCRFSAAIVVFLQRKLPLK